MPAKNHLPPELDPSEPDPALEPTHEVGEPGGKHAGKEHDDPELEPGIRHDRP